MSNRTRVGIPTSRTSPDLVVNTDGSINVQTSTGVLVAQTPTQVLVQLAATAVIVANANRKIVEIFNMSAVTLYIAWTSAVTIADTPILPFTSLIISGYQGPIWGISTVANADIRVTEFI